MPDLVHGSITPERNLWLGDAAALVKLMGDTTKTVRLHVASEYLHEATREGNAHSIIAVVNRALAKARREVPAFQGALIEAGRPYDAFAAVGNVLRAAKSGALLVDCYADEKVVEHFVQLAPFNVPVRLLTTKMYIDRLKTAVERWVRQHGNDRPLECQPCRRVSRHAQSLATKNCGSRPRQSPSHPEWACPAPGWPLHASISVASTHRWPDCSICARFLVHAVSGLQRNSKYA
jgi:hypothetical protein